ncbi:hypothetical protein CDAR_394351 [Caerostris darwini]|uniref:Uncharacterized protein n=1 Tax=Caerostris darwini TaxID=1538125 RepID=A0AAV4RHI4_9ARAC|nr:hypothetical protein CDAR_394351 [Caerostris darwini]
MMPRGEEFFDPPNPAVNQEERNGGDAGAEKSLSPSQLPSSAACLRSRPPVLRLFTNYTKYPWCTSVLSKEFSIPRIKRTSCNLLRGENSTLDSNNPAQPLHKASHCSQALRRWPL